MRSRRGIISSGFRSQKNWLETASDFGASSAWLIDGLTYYDKIGSQDIYRPQYDPPVMVNLREGPRQRIGSLLNSDYTYQSPSLTKPTGSALTLECWVKRTGTNVIDNAYLAVMSVPGFSFLLKSNGDIVADRPGADYTISGISDDNWHQLVQTTDGSTPKLYVDGNLVSTGSGSTSSFSTYALYIGGFGSETGVNYGCDNTIVSSVAVYPNELNGSQIRQLYLAQGPDNIHATPHLTSFDSSYFTTKPGVGIGGFSQSVSLDIYDLMSGVAEFDSNAFVGYIAFSLECVNDGTATKRAVSISSEAAYVDNYELGFWDLPFDPTVQFTSSQNLTLGSFSTAPGVDIATGEVWVYYILPGKNTWLFDPSHGKINLYVNYIDGSYGYQINELGVAWYK